MSNSFIAIKMEANIDERIFKISRRILGLVNAGGSNAIIALCEELDFLEPVLDKLADTRSVKSQLSEKQRTSKEKAQVKTAILAGGDTALLALDETVKNEKVRRGL